MKHGVILTFLVIIFQFVLSFLKNKLQFHFKESEQWQMNLFKKNFLHILKMRMYPY